MCEVELLSTPIRYGEGRRPFLKVDTSPSKGGTRETKAPHSGHTGVIDAFEYSSMLHSIPTLLSRSALHALTSSPLRG